MKTINHVSLSILLTAILATILGGCKKYEENPEFNLTTRSQRLKGVYTLAGYFVDNVDSPQR